MDIRSQSKSDCGYLARKDCVARLTRQALPLGKRSNAGGERIGETHKMKLSARKLGAQSRRRLADWRATGSCR